jgi:hypothetical protein
MRWPHRSTNGKPPRRCKNRCAAAAPSLHRRCPTSPPPLAQGRPDAEPCRCGRLRCRSPATPTTPSLSCVGPHRAAPSTASRRRSTGSSPSTPSLVRRRSSTPLKPSAADAFAILAGQLGSPVHSFFARRPSLYPRRSASPAAPVTAAAKPRRRERVAQASAWPAYASTSSPVHTRPLPTCCASPKRGPESWATGPTAVDSAQGALKLFYFTKSVSNILQTSKIN